MRFLGDEDRHDQGHWPLDRRNAAHVFAGAHGHSAGRRFRGARRVSVAQVLTGTAQAKRIARDRESLGTASHRCRMVSLAHAPRARQCPQMNGLGREGPLQNRVTPFGDIVAIPQRGIFTGNRGIIHDPATKTLLRKRWASRAWLICRCDYKDRRRDVMAGWSWTELFFLDEAVALAAGHRPCFLCRRNAAESFRAAWRRQRKRGSFQPLPWTLCSTASGSLVDE